METLPENTQRQLNVKELEKLIFISFMHSQGDENLQMDLALWFNEYYGVQSEERYDEAFDAFCKSSFTQQNDLKLAKKLLHAGSFPDPEHGSKITDQGARDQQQYLDELVSETDYKIDTEFLKVTFDQILSLDLQYLEKGRPNRKAHAASDTLADPYFSFSVHYLVRKNKTGNAAMDLLYEKLQVTLEDEGIASKLKDVITLYNNHHPDNLFDENCLVQASAH